jgi:hypothetical protein
MKETNDNSDEEQPTEELIEIHAVELPTRKRLGEAVEACAPGEGHDAGFPGAEAVGR